MLFIIDLFDCLGIPVWLLATQSPTQQAWMFSPNSPLTSRTQTLRPMKVSRSIYQRLYNRVRLLPSIELGLFWWDFMHQRFLCYCDGLKTSREHPC